MPFDYTGKDPQTGYFAAGNKLGKGNPGNRRIAELRRTLMECGTPERIREVEESLFQAAKGGDVPAMRTWLEFMVGKPTTAIELSTGDGGGINATIVMQTILGALGDYPEARVAVAATFRKLALESQQTSDG